MIGTYSLSLYALTTITLVAFIIQNTSSSPSETESPPQPEQQLQDGQREKYKSKSIHKYWSYSYLVVFGLVTGSDWLQGPYLFSLYHDEFHVSLHTIAVLFVLGFLSAGLTAPIIGYFADTFGRKLTCLCFCLLYTLSCVTKLSPWLPYLGLGRLLGGISTSILFSTFESYLVSTAHSHGMLQADLAALIGRCTLLNGVVASLAGVVSDALVEKTKTFKSPFVASGVLLILAGIVIAATWEENYGGGRTLDNEQEEEDEDQEENGKTQQKTSNSKWSCVFTTLKSEPKLWVVPLAMTAFEASMYLFVFLWVPTMNDALNPNDPALPLGTIFSCFMTMMMGGSIFYNSLIARFKQQLVTPPSSPKPESVPLPDSTPASVLSSNITVSHSHFPSHSHSPRATGERAPLLPRAVSRTRSDCPCSSSSGALNNNSGISILSLSQLVTPGEDSSSSSTIKLHAVILGSTLLAAAAALGVSAIVESPIHKFGGFLLFEFCVGVYYPTVGTLRSAFLPEECRASLTAIFRVPLNLTVTLALITGMESRRTLVSTLSCTSLIVGALVVYAVLLGQVSSEKKRNSGR